MSRVVSGGGCATGTSGGGSSDGKGADVIRLPSISWFESARSIGVMRRVVLALTCVLLSTSVLAAPKIQWRVEAGFAPFAWTSNPGEISRRWMPMSDSGVVETFDEWYLRLAREGNGISDSPYSKFAQGQNSPWDQAKGHYLDAYARPKDVTILAKADDMHGSCKWVVRPSSVVQPIHVSASCEVEAALTIPLAGADISVTSDSGAIATETVAIDHRVVIGLGDSYAAGEGNPDVPTQWRNEAPKPNTYDWFASSKPGKSLIAQDARWFDTACHRSFWSHQTYTAMRLAAENPHRRVTFLHYACSGAEIFDGMLVRQRQPPGLKKLCNDNRDPASCFVPRSQLAAAVIDLCKGGEQGTTPTSQWIKDFSANVATKSKPFYKMGTYHVAERKLGSSLDLFECTGEQRKPDLVLISIGGNDAGFGQLAMWAIAPYEVRSKILDVFYGIGLKVTNATVCPEMGIHKGKCDLTDVDLIRQIARRYDLLSDALDNLVKVSPEKVVVASLPDPIRREYSVSPQLCSDEEGVHFENAWDGARGLLPWPGLTRSKKWAFNILGNADDSEAAILAKHTLPELRKAIGLGAMSNGFIFASETSEAFVGHGWCERSDNDQPIALPSSSPAEWRCPGSVNGSPACWKPYQPALRYIRTINDSLLTQASSRNDGINGSVHPTAQGQAAVAIKLIDYVHNVPGWAPPEK